MGDFNPNTIPDSSKGLEKAKAHFMEEHERCEELRKQSQAALVANGQMSQHEAARHDAYFAAKYGEDREVRPRVVFWNWPLDDHYGEVLGPNLNAEQYWSARVLRQAALDGAPRLEFNKILPPSDPVGGQEHNLPGDDRNPTHAQAAMYTLMRAMKVDLSPGGVAWGWQCNLAMAYLDMGATHEDANRAAARFMRATFEIDWFETDQWKSFEDEWLQQAKMRDAHQAALISAVMQPATQAEAELWQALGYFSVQIATTRELAPPQRLLEAVAALVKLIPVQPQPAPDAPPPGVKPALAGFDTLFGVPK